MPSQTAASKQDILNEFDSLKLTKTNDKFADFNTILSFSKEYITSKMITLTNEKESFLIGSLKKEPLLIAKDQKIIVPKYEKNELVPLKPIQRLNSFAESSGSLILSHGLHSLEFGKIVESIDTGCFNISRSSQKNLNNPYKKVLFATDNEFYGKSDSEVDFYDFQRVTKIGSLSSKGNILDFDFCPLQTSILAYTNGSLNITDSRESSFRTNHLYKQHNMSHLVRWNPTVPYWLATANTNSLNIFDIRYNSASPVLSIQHANIQDLCWSPCNSDLILATSKDRRTNLWSLSHSQDDCRLRMAMNRFELGCIGASKSTNHVFYGLDDADSLVKIKIRPEYLTSIAPISNVNDLEYKEIEDSLYSADYENFRSKLSEIAEKAFENSNYTKLKQLVLLTMPPSRTSQFMKFDEKVVSSIGMKGDFQDFKELLVQSTSTSFKEPFSPKQSEEIQKFIDQLRLKIRVVELLASEDFESLAKFLDLVSEAFSRDLNFLDRKQSIKFMAFILKNDRKCAFDLLTKIIAVNPFGTPEILQIWIWQACYPSIFDPKSFELIKIRPYLSKSIADLEAEDVNEAKDDFKIERYLEKMRQSFYDSLISNPRIGPESMKIVNQLNLNLGINPMNLNLLLKTELNCSSALKDVQRALLEESGNVFIISTELIKSLLEKTLRSSSKLFLVDFFLIAFRLQVLTEKTPIYSGIQEFVTSVGFARLKFLLSFINSQNAVKAINSIIAIGTDHYSNLSEDQLNYLADQLKILTEKIDDFSMINTDFLIENGLKSTKFKLQLKKYLKII